MQATTLRGARMRRSRRFARLPFPLASGLILAMPLLGDAAPPDEPPTYAKDVAPILQARCQHCHRKGQVAPFGLETYEQARKRSSDILSVVEDRIMPPWMPQHGVGPKLHGDPSLSEQEIATLQAWADAGSPPGDPADLPPPRVFREDWILGPPDLVLQPSEEFTIPASGPDTYRCFVIPTNLTKDTYLSAVEFRPSNPRVVHHLNVYISTCGTGRKLDAAESGPGYNSYAGPGFPAAGELGFWAAGNEPMHLPEGIARVLPKGADLILQVHYHPTGKPEVDRSSIGLHFAQEPVKRAFHWADATSVGFKIPENRPNFEVKATWFVPEDVEALAVAPHMHMIGRDFRISVADSKGRERDLLYIPSWDPNWQASYAFEEPVTLTKGSVLKVVAHYDNTAHPRNPNNPPKQIRWGFGTGDEMCVGYIGVVKKNQDLTQANQHDDLYRILMKQRWDRFKRERLVARQRD